MFTLTNNLAVLLSILNGTAKLNIPTGKNKWFLPVVTRSDAIIKFWNVTTLLPHLTTQ